MSPLFENSLTLQRSSVREGPFRSSFFKFTLFLPKNLFRDLGYRSVVVGEEVGRINPLL